MCAHRWPEQCQQQSWRRSGRWSPSEPTLFRPGNYDGDDDDDDDDDGDEDGKISNGCTKGFPGTWSHVAGSTLANWEQPLLLPDTILHLVKI